MKLILHHFWKDVRTLRGILGLWLLVIVTQAVALFLAVQPGYQVAHVAEIIGSSAMWSLVNFATWMSVIVYLIQSEPVTGASSFWLTRPIPPLVSVTSKLIFILGLVIVPGLVPRTIDFLLFGIPCHEIYLTTLVTVYMELMWVLCIVWLATYTRSMAQFWGVLGLLFILFGSFSIGFVTVETSVGFTSRAESNLGLMASRFLIAVVVFFGGLIVSLIVQYWLRTTRKAFLLGVGSPVLSIALFFWWPFVLRPIGSVRLDVALAVCFAGWLVSLIIQCRSRAARRALQVGMGGTLLSIALYFGGPFVLHRMDHWVVPSPYAKPIQLAYQLDTTKPFTWSETQLGNVSFQVTNGRSDTQLLNPSGQNAKAPLIAPPPGADGAPIIRSIDSSFQPGDGKKISLPESLDGYSYFKTDRLDWLPQLQQDNPGLTIAGAPAPTNEPVPVFVLNSELTGKLKDQTGTLDLKINGDLASIEKRAEIPLTGTGFARIPRALVRLVAIQHDKDGINLSVEEVGYADMLKWASLPTVYFLVDPNHRMGFIPGKLVVKSQLTNVSSGTLSRMSAQLALEVKASDLPEAMRTNFDRNAMNGWVLYVYEITSHRSFKSEVNVPNYTFHPGER